MGHREASGFLAGGRFEASKDTSVQGLQFVRQTDWHEVGRIFSVAACLFTSSVK
jgi:hypothetical protein